MGPYRSSDERRRRDRERKQRKRGRTYGADISPDLHPGADPPTPPLTTCNNNYRAREACPPCPPRENVRPEIGASFTDAELARMTPEELRATVRVLAPDYDPLAGDCRGCVTGPRLFDGLCWDCAPPEARISTAKESR